MRRFRPRTGALALPLLLAACATEPAGLPPPVPDDDCVLLCALQRALTGPPDAGAAPVAAPAPRPRFPAAHHTPARAASAPAHAVSRRPNRLRPRHRKIAPAVPLRTDTSVAPPVIEPAPPIATPFAPPPPAPAVVAPVPPASLSQAIPGSIGIMRPTWQP